ncbi:MAG: ABC transporter substrate-binding protein [Rhodospirillales bacterium]|jgi:NitT/TauT family transport system substrate-binding protein|nr:ABC transporter substrate-binding protein [Rhodospirillales bacterium]MDP6644760.1 ABC transporter substrate-binding protein [Rhodospirillales bacterium]
MKTISTTSLYLGSALVLSAAVTQPAASADKIIFMKVVPHPFAFLMADVGKEQGIFKKHGIDLDIIGTRGSAKLHQALAAGSADIGLGSGVGLGFVSKGAPEIGFLASHGAPLNLGIVVSNNSPLYKKGMSVKDLKGRRIGVSTPSSLTYFLSRRLAAEQGWGPDGITAVPLGGLSAQLAAAKAGNTAAFVMSIDAGFNLESRKSGRVFLAFGDYIKNFHTHVLFVTNKFRNKNPDTVKRFSRAWLESTKYVLNNKEAMVQRAIKQLKFNRSVASKSYDIESPAFSTTGRFNNKALDVIAEGLVMTKILKTKPDMSKTYTEEYLP